MHYDRQREVWASELLEGAGIGPTWHLQSDGSQGVFAVWFVLTLEEPTGVVRRAERVRLHLETSPDGEHWMRVASSVGRRGSLPRGELVPVRRGLGRFVRAVSEGSQPHRAQVWLASNRGFAPRGSVG